MELIKKLKINLRKKELIVFVGAGGKTTNMFNLARELRDQEKKVLVTTTTAIYYPDNENCDRIIVTKNIMENIFQEIIVAGITVIGNMIAEEGKLKGIQPNIIDEIYRKDIFDFILVEGDGSKHKSIKAPAEHEPVIPELSTMTIAVIGLDAVGKNINHDNVHRTEEFCEITNKKLEDIITEEDLMKITTHKKGLFKNTPENCRRILLLNKVGSTEEIKMVERITRKISMNNNLDIIGIRKEGN